MSQMPLSVASSGALTLRQQPDWNIMRSVCQAVTRLISDATVRKRRTKIMEGTMYPDHHNRFAAPAQGSAFNAGQFGSVFAPHPCNICAKEHHAYDAQEPARPQINLRQAVHALFARKSK